MTTPSPAPHPSLVALAGVFLALIGMALGRGAAGNWLMIVAAGAALLAATALVASSIYLLRRAR